MPKHTPKVTAYTISGPQTKVYDPAIARTPADVDVSLFNDGDTLVYVWFGNTTGDPIKLVPGAGLTHNSSSDVFASTSGAVGSVTVGEGVRAYQSGVSSAGSLSPTELATLYHSISQREAVIALLQQQKLTNEYLSYIADLRLFERDIPVDAN